MCQMMLDRIDGLSAQIEELSIKIDQVSWVKYCPQAKRSSCGRRVT
jgi:hypothetical protein